VDDYREPSLPVGSVVGLAGGARKRPPEGGQVEKKSVEAQLETSSNRTLHPTADA